MAWQTVQSELARAGDSISRDLREMLHVTSRWIDSLGEVERLVFLCLGVLGLFYMLMRRSKSSGETESGGGYFAAAVLVLVVFGVVAGRMISGDLSLPGFF